jgi:hypothetical protein
MDKNDGNWAAAGGNVSQCNPILEGNGIRQCLACGKDQEKQSYWQDANDLSVLHSSSLPF